MSAWLVMFAGFYAAMTGIMAWVAKEACDRADEETGERHPVLRVVLIAVFAASWPVVLAWAFLSKDAGTT